MTYTESFRAVFCRVRGTDQTKEFGIWRRAGSMLLALASMQMAVVPVQAQMLPNTSSASTPSGSPVNRESQDNSDNNESRPSSAGDAVSNFRIEPVAVQGSDTPLKTGESTTVARAKAPPPPNEFEKFVQFHTGKKLVRFGTDLLVPDARDYAKPATATVPPDYLLNVGDVVIIAMTGAIEGSVDKEIDTNGRIFLPRVGPVQLAGVRYGDLKAVIGNAIGTQYRGYTVNVGIRALRGIRVYVTGFANNPGAYTLTSLSTLANAVFAAGGPSAGGSFRSVKLLRNGEVVRDYDLYQLLLDGNRRRDAVLQNEDVLRIEPVGPEVAITGSVNNEAIYETKPGETIEQLLTYAGGPSNLADTTRVMLYRVTDKDPPGVQQIARAEAASMPVQGGDILQLLSEGSLLQSIARQNVLVRVEGEVERPGNYYLPANSPIDAVMARAGGITPRAFVFGTRFERTSVRLQQRDSYREAIDQLELSLAAAPLTGGGLGASDRGAQIAAAREVLEKMKQTEPDGRVVLDLAPTATALPGDFVLENNDRIVIPPRPTTVGVFGAVYRPASFVLDTGRPMTIESYLKRAGGPLKSAARGQIFVVRANGAVLAKENGALKAKALPGDVVFVPVKTQSSSIWTKIRELSTILFQVGLSAAAFITVTQ